MSRIHVDKASRVPIHDQIKEQITGLIHAGRLKTGDQIPTMRALSIKLGVNFNTVAHAYRELDVEGIIATKRGQGTFVTSTPNATEMRRLRQEKLLALVKALFEETERLGYHKDEIRPVIEEQFNQP
jgi:GntR family transcriptional regulator